MMSDSVQGGRQGHNTDRQTEKWISDLAGVFTDPVICHRGQLDRPPQKIREAITLQRLIENMVALKEGRSLLGTDAECAWYLSSASLEAPLSSEWTRIYMYTFNQTCATTHTEVPEDLRQESLDQYEMGLLLGLKQWIYQVRSENRKQIDRADRQEKKEQARQEKENLQPQMFEF
jgi:hypothetical protein